MKKEIHAEKHREERGELYGTVDKVIVAVMLNGYEGVWLILCWVCTV